MRGYCGSFVCKLRLRLFVHNDTRLPLPCTACLAALRADVAREAKRRWLK